MATEVVVVVVVVCVCAGREGRRREGRWTSSSWCGLKKPVWFSCFVIFIVFHFFNFFSDFHFSIFFLFFLCFFFSFLGCSTSVFFFFLFCFTISHYISSEKKRFLSRLWDTPLKPFFFLCFLFFLCFSFSFPFSFSFFRQRRRMKATPPKGVGKTATPPKRKGRKAAPPNKKGKSTKKQCDNFDFQRHVGTSSVTLLHSACGAGSCCWCVASADRVRSDDRIALPFFRTLKLKRLQFHGHRKEARSDAPHSVLFGP